MNCSNCGNLVSEDDKICPKCGHKLDFSKKSKMNAVALVIGIIIIIAIVGVVLYSSGIFVSNNNQAPVVNNTTQNSNAVVANNANNNSSSNGNVYWASTQTNKFHDPSCEWAQKIDESHKIVYDSRQKAIDDGREPCKVCKP